MLSNNKFVRIRAIIILFVLGLSFYAWVFGNNDKSSAHTSKESTYETTDSYESSDTTSSKETTLSYSDQEYKEWYNEIFDTWYDTMLELNKNTIQGDFCSDSFYDVIERAKDLSREITIHPTPTDPSLKKLDRELKGKASAPYSAVVASKTVRN